MADGRATVSGKRDIELAVERQSPETLGDFNHGPSQQEGLVRPLEVGENVGRHDRALEVLQKLKERANACGESCSEAGDLEFADRLIREAKIATIPLSPFYAVAPRMTLLRLCIAKRDATLETAAARLRRGMQVEGRAVLGPDRLVAPRAACGAGSPG